MIDPRREAEGVRSVRHLRTGVGRRIDGLLAGEFVGLRPGAGDELDRIRSYQPGDDVRRMAWAATARTGEPAVRSVIADHALEVTIVVDLTASMEFGTVRTTKRHLALVLTAALSHLLDDPGNRLRVVLVEQDGTRVHGPGPVGLVVHRALRGPTAGRAAASGGSDPADPLAVALTGLVRRATRPGRVVVITDLVGGTGVGGTGVGGTGVGGTGPEDPLAVPVRRLAARHEVSFVEVLDPRELDLPDVGHLHLVDPESGRELHVNTADRRLRARFHQAAADRRAARRAVLHRCGADLVVLRTDRDWLRDLARHLVLRRTAGGSRRRATPAREGVLP